MSNPKLVKQPGKITVGAAGGALGVGGDVLVSQAEGIAKVY